MATMRSVIKTVRSTLTSDGAGVKLRRSIASSELEELDPFLLLDEFGSDNPGDYIAGFPPHPHRGFETVTYMLAGSFRHEDNAGHAGTLDSGGVQWMTAGRGIIHSEMPLQQEGRVHGFQLWVNLPSKDKMRAPRYQNIQPGEIPETSPTAGVKVKVIAGEINGVKGPVTGIVTDPVYLDVLIDPNREWRHTIPSNHTLFTYVFEGSASFGGDDAKPVERGTLAIFGDGDEIIAKAGDKGARFITVAAVPIGEPIARYGPFVMNTSDEIRQAIADYRSGNFGE